MNFPILNADLGEGESPEVTVEFIRKLGAANIACGGHAGTEASMRTCLRLCRQYGTLAGAHPGMAEAFGRGQHLPDPKSFQNLLHQQWNTIARIAREENVDIHHIKLHGQLYSAVEKEAELRSVFLDFLGSFEKPPVCFALATGSLVQVGAEQGLNVWKEAFADRAYEDDGSLTPRDQPGAVLDQPEKMRHQIHHWNQTGRIVTRSGKSITLQADTVCLHSDSPKALEALHLLAPLLNPCT